MSDAMDFLWVFGMVLGVLAAIALGGALLVALIVVVPVWAGVLVAFVAFASLVTYLLVTL